MPSATFYLHNSSMQYICMINLQHSIYISQHDKYQHTLFFNAVFNTVDKSSMHSFTPQLNLSRDDKSQLSKNASQLHKLSPPTIFTVWSQFISMNSSHKKLGFPPQRGRTSLQQEDFNLHAVHLSSTNTQNPKAQPQSLHSSQIQQWSGSRPSKIRLRPMHFKFVGGGALNTVNEEWENTITRLESTLSQKHR